MTSNHYQLYGVCKRLKCVSGTNNDGGTDHLLASLNRVETQKKQFGTAISGNSTMGMQVSSMKGTGKKLTAKKLLQRLTVDIQVG